MIATPASVTALTSLSMSSWPASARPSRLRVSSSGSSLPGGQPGLPARGRADGRLFRAAGPAELAPEDADEAALDEEEAEADGGARMAGCERGAGRHEEVVADQGRQQRRRQAGQESTVPGRSHHGAEEQQEGGPGGVDEGSEGKRGTDCEDHSGQTGGVRSLPSKPPHSIGRLVFCQWPLSKLVPRRRSFRAQNFTRPLVFW